MLFRLQIFYILLFLLIGSNAFGQYSLEIKIPVEKKEGIVLLGLYNGPDQYLEEAGMFRHCMIEADQDSIVCAWDSLPAGNYSMAMLHDLNGNRKMDFNFIGWPKEDYGFYPDPGFMMRKPRWEECNFDLKENLKLTMRIR